MIDVDLTWANVYVTHEEMFGRPMSDRELLDDLGQMAVDDCLEALGRLSCMVEGQGVTSVERQKQIITRLGIPEAAENLNELLRPRGEAPRSLFFPQQIVHLTRLALEHADRRPRDGFDDGRLAGRFVRLVFGVSDLFGNELGRGTRDDVRAFILRQLGLMSRGEPVYLFSRYYELLVRLWPQVHGDTGFAPAAAFERHTGLTLEQYFTVGFAIYARFLNHVDAQQEPAEFGLHPASYFGQAQVAEQQWRAVIELLSGTADELREGLREEERRYGPTIYRAHTFDRTPLAVLDGGVLVPTSFAALARAVTEGAFWLLADAAKAEGLPREQFTSPFGRVFERFTQESLERIAALEDPAPHAFRDFPYAPKRQRVLSSDMSLLYDDEGIFFEAVTGRPNVATETRGDPVAFREDLRRLVLKKARQLKRCWEDFFIFGFLRFPGVANDRIRRVWPVIVLVEGFPLMPPIYGEVVEKLRRDGWPPLAPRIALIDADELAAMETLVEQGWTTRRILATWRREAPQLPLSNWLASSPTLGGQKLGHASWHKRSFAELSETVTRMLFGRAIDLTKDEPPDEDR